MSESRGRFEIDYANGKVDFAASLADAERKVAHETRDGRVHGLLPARIRCSASDVIGVGEIVETITDEDVASAGPVRSILR